ncbi:YlxR family protein [Nocardioides caeni]|uniref:YlxR family protein n=1 Tax=Nocardioides caeni TaxID=574700 RepID=UPI0023AEBA8C|nr:YlxR family protein [Nocardioides caeni]
MARRLTSSAGPDDSALAGPVRTCVGCRQRAARSELLRVTAGSDGSTGQTVVLPDPDATAPGRGAHLHPTPGCYDLAVRRKAFARALRLAGVGGRSSAPVGDYVGSLASSNRTAPTTRDWSSSS